MMKRFRWFAVVLICVVAAPFAAGQKDRAGSKDHPLFSRMPGFFINDYKETEFDEAEFFVTENGKETKQRVEGHLYSFGYVPGRDIVKPSVLQVVRNYQNAAAKIGGKTLNDASMNGGAVRRTTIKVVKDNAEVWSQIQAWPSGYRVVIVEKQGMKQDVVADAAAFANDIRSTGKVAVYGIYFDTAKSDLKPESDVAIAEIGKLLQENPTLKVYVVGHTDMVGDAIANEKLSHARAQSVVNALVTRHKIAAARLVPHGAGPYAPVAPNRDEDGRAKNRRVELVEIATK